jgi:uncharacterized protein
VLAPSYRPAIGRPERPPVPPVAGLGPLGRKWGAWVLLEVERRRAATFTELLRENPRLSPRILSIRLRELTRDGLVRRNAPDQTRTVRYALGPNGRRVTAAAAALVHELSTAEGGGPRASSTARPLAMTMTAGVGPATHRPTSAPPGSAASPVFRDQCGRCGTALPPSAEAYVCSDSCTWCAACGQRFAQLCPNCGRPLGRRRVPAPVPNARRPAA